MAVLTIRNVPDEVHRALKARAREHGRSAEAEVRAILDGVLLPPQRTGLGSAIVAIARELEITDAEVDEWESSFDRTPHEPMTFS